MLMAGTIDVRQIDACRLGGVNEVLVVLLTAQKFGLPIVPHLSTIDCVVVAGGGSLEFVDRLHEHFVNPAVIRDGYYTTLTQPSYSVEMKKENYREFECPLGRFWKREQARSIMEHFKRRLPSVGGGMFATSNGHSTDLNSLDE